MKQEQNTFMVLFKEFIIHAVSDIFRYFIYRGSEIIQFIEEVARDCSSTKGFLTIMLCNLLCFLKKIFFWLKTTKTSSWWGPEVLSPSSSSEVSSLKLRVTFPMICHIFSRSSSLSNLTEVLHQTSHAGLFWTYPCNAVSLTERKYLQLSTAFYSCVLTTNWASTFGKSIFSKYM